MKFRKNYRNVGDGMKMLKSIRASTLPLVFFDPQYRTLLDRMKYGNEGVGRQRDRKALRAMDKSLILDFMGEIERVLRPSGHLMMWVEKYALVQGTWLFEGLPVVDMITWKKPRIGMGYRSRSISEFLLIMQKPPIRAKGIWQYHNIPDVIEATAERSSIKGAHEKPILLQASLIGCVTRKGDLVVDPCAGSFSVMKAARMCGRNFLGTDIKRRKE